MAFRIPVVDVVVAVVVLAVVVPPSVLLVLNAGAPVAVGTAVATVVLAAALVLRRRSPAPAFAAGSAAMLLLALLPNLTDGPSPLYLPVSLIYVLLLYTVVAETAHAVLPLLVALTGVALVGLRTAFDGGAGAGWVEVALAVAAMGAVLAGAWALGRYHRTRAQYLEAARERARQAEELRDHAVHEGVAAERRLIAAEMHDVVAHSLAVVVRQSDAALLLLDRDPARARTMIEAARDVGREAMGEMRSMLTVLRDGGAAPDSPAASVDEVVALVAGFPAARCTVRVLGGPADVTAPVARAAHRIVQEGLTNAVKHAGRPVTCAVSLTHLPGALRVEIVDDGPGFASDPGRGGRAQPGWGLPGMRERAQRLGGTLEITSSDDGTRLVATLPTGATP